MPFATHSLDSAPLPSREALGKLVQNYGFLPNLAGKFAESPAALNGLLGFMGAFESKDMTLTALERQVVLLTVSAWNECVYCAAAHSMMANMSGLERGQIDNLHRGKPLADVRLEALRRFVETVLERKGWADEADVRLFLDAGFTKAQVFEVLFGIALKTFTNYANHITKPEVNAQFAGFLPTWAKAA